jgi:hypothetical protein
MSIIFGEIDLRFGVFWRPLKFSLKTSGHIIDACLWLHNFILENLDHSFMGSNDKDVFDEDCRRHFAIHLDILEGVNGVELGTRRPRRPCRLEAMSATVGKHWWDLICSEIPRQGLTCPSMNWY